MLQRLSSACNGLKSALKKNHYISVARYASGDLCKNTTPKQVFKGEAPDGDICKSVGAVSAGGGCGAGAGAGAGGSTRPSACGKSGPPVGQGTIYKKIFFFVCLPVILYKTYADILVGHDDEPERGPCIDYDYMGILNKPYMWGDGRRTLFHNPKKNYLPHCEPED